MAIGLQVWSPTPVTNATADSNINWSEGQAPSSVNDSARAMMASAAKWRDDNNGTLITSGTTLAVTLVTNQVEAALTSGYTISVLWGATPDTAATLAVDGLAAAAIQPVYGTNITYGNLQAGQINSLTYTTGTGASPAWILKNFAYPLLSTGVTTQGSAFAPVLGTATNTLASSAQLTTAGPTDGPSVSVSTAGVYYVVGQGTFNGAANARGFIRLWDGTTIVSEATVVIPAANLFQTVTLTGVITNPVANVRLSGVAAAGSTVGFTAYVAASSSTAVSTGKTASYINTIRIG